MREVLELKLKLIKLFEEREIYLLWIEKLKREIQILNSEKQINEMKSLIEHSKNWLKKNKREIEVIIYNLFLLKK